MNDARVQRVVVGGLLFMVLALGYVLRHQPDGRVHMWLRPGQGGLIETAEGSYILLDGGQDPVALNSFLGAHMSLLQWQLDLVVLTRWRQQNTAAQVDALRRYVPRRVWYPSSQPRTGVQAPWWDAIARADQLRLAPGLTYEQGGVRVEVVSTAPVVVQVQVGRFMLVYTPALRLDEAPTFGSPSTVWMTRHLPNTVSTLPALVLLPAQDVDSLPADVVLNHPQTTFLLARPEQELALTTDGARFSWRWHRR